MVKKIAIISYTSRKEGCLSGVERYNDLLQKAIGGEIYTGTMFNMPNPQTLNKFLVDKKEIDENTLCIVDGSWGLNIPKNIPVISVVHGTWTEFNLRNHGKLEVEPMQDRMWHRPNTKMVAVSYASAKYLELHHRVRANKIILNGVDADEFCLGKKGINKLPVVLHCARDYNKGSHGKIDKIIELLKNKFEFKMLKTPEGMEWEEYQKADIVLQCSNYEGNSYFMLEGMACGLPVVASSAGLFEDLNCANIGCVVDWKASAEDFAKTIQYVWENRFRFNPRQWILDNANFEMWKKQWQDFLRDNYEI